ncbi:MAG: protein-L-isoaspartate(D-aspartate) O-methyltransferase [Burkholderiaceae bacterium]
MSDKPRRFPLPLSSVAGNNDAAKRNGPETVRQTAMQNALRHDAARRALAASPTPPRPAVALRATQTQGQGSLVSGPVRRAMVERIAARGVRHPAVLAAMETVPRHLFIDAGLASQAYIDASLPIGHQQTISQPYIVARMIETLCEGVPGGRPARVLEIGTGCGYQAAVLAQVAAEVYSIERIRGLHELAKTNLRPMRIPNLRLHYGDGMLGLPQAAPFDGIILAAAGLDVPQTLIEQLAVGGRLVAPVGADRQVLQLIQRTGKSEWSRSTLEDCHFVPLRPGTMP